MSLLPDLKPGDPASPLVPPRLLPFSRVGPLGLVLMAGVVVLALFLLVQTMAVNAPAPGTPTPAPAQQGPDEIAKEPQIQFLGEGDLAEQYPTMVRDELQQEILDWFQQTGRQAISDRAAALEDEWVNHFLSDEVRPRLERLPGWVFGELGDVARIVDEPGPHRGKLVQIWGSVREIDEIPLPTTPPSAGRRVRIDDQQGRAWTIVTTKSMPESVHAGSWVKAYGVFVKVWPVEEGRPSFLVLSAQKLAPSFPPVEQKAISPEWAEDVEDATLNKSQHRPGDEDAFWSLMNYVRTLGPEGYRAKVRSGELKVTDMTGSSGATDLAQRPALHRFELVRLRVGIAKGEGAFVTEQDLPENVGNISSVFRGFVIDDQQRVIWVMTPFAADAFKIGDARLAIVEGFFYKRMAVEKKSGGLYWMPVLVGTAIYPVNTAPREKSTAQWAAWIAIAGAATCVVLYLVLSARTRRAAEETRRRHAQRIAERAAEKQRAT